ncbi:response regulator [Paenibacillus eucommiae]|uniref:Two-component system response regulator YesN n=1 Tax=Paenibacillus eucommiae TaxID=1355755 RepID=A0ABS4IYL7_9BACL|nr:response regulator [Paenibacillus eucommiae]MBP1992071.1 two-component system response regulator YesN [Paenibacillus eucommiae]
MKSVLIVDDEPFVRAGLKESIDWQKFGYDHIYEADNGLKGLHDYKRLQPDLIVTDIRMPIMDGIDFCTEMLKLNRDAKIIVLSSYMDFEYVRQAFKLGVIDYLLKHQMTEQQLAPILLRLEEEDKKRGGSFNRLGKQAYLRHWLAGTLSAVAESHAEPYSFSAEDHLQIINIQIDDYKWIRKSSTLWRNPAEMEARAAAVAEEVLASYKSDITELHEGSLFAIIAFSNSLSRSEAHTLAVQITHKLQQKLQSELGIAVSALYHPLLVSVDKLPECYKRMNAQKGHFHCRGDIDAYGSGSVQQAGSGTQRIDLAEWKNNLLQGQYAWLTKELRNLWLHKGPGLSDNEIRMCFSEIVNALYNEFQAASLLPSSEGLLDVSVEHFNTFEGLYEWSVSCVEQLERLSSAAVKKAGSSKIRSIQQYIDAHLHEDLTLDAMAEKMHFNKMYLSDLFKQAVGITYTQYVTEARVAHARRLLTQSTLSIQEISEQVGFNDAAYFIKTFRKYTGQPPLKFRKQSVKQ